MLLSLEGRRPYGWHVHGRHFACRSLDGPMLARRADEGCDIHATTDFFRRMKLGEIDYDETRAKLAVDGSRLRSTAPTLILSGETEAAKAGRSTSVKDNFFGNNATSMTKAKITPIAISNRSTAAPIRRRAQFCSSPRQSFVIAPGMQPSPDFIPIAGGPRCRPRAALPLLACNAFCSHDGSATEQY
jgi:hypothetical protein